MDINFLFLYFVAVLQIGTTFYFIFAHIKNISKAKFIILSILVLLISSTYIYFALMPIKENIEEKNQCIWFYREFPSYDYSSSSIKVNFLDKCDKWYGEEGIELLKESGMNQKNRLYSGEIQWDFGNLP